MVLLSRLEGEMASLEREYRYFKAHQDELVEKYGGKFIVIVEDEVVAAYENELEAYTEMKSKYGLGHFLLQECLPQDQLVQYHSRVAFS
ncbi:MAG: DUF5678 domain-containing protein [Chloroflexi bacterium]|nr:DUF5678 domain-containing protein [Chloroflexota bacterium]